MNSEQLTQLLQQISELPQLVARFGGDGEKIKAFVEDVKDALGKAKTEEEKMALYGTLTVTMLYLFKGVKDWKFYSFNTWDIFKPMRLKCDDIARTCNFERYKALRGL